MLSNSINQDVVTQAQTEQVASFCAMKTQSETSALMALMTIKTDLLMQQTAITTATKIVSAMMTTGTAISTKTLLAGTLMVME